MIKSGGILGELLVALPYAAIKAGTQELIKRAPELTRYATRYFVNKEINRIKKRFCINPNKAGIFEGSFSLGGRGQFDSPLPPPPFIFQEELI